jgi:hypothetical protein
MQDSSQKEAWSIGKDDRGQRTEGRRKLGTRKGTEEMLSVVRGPLQEKNKSEGRRRGWLIRKLEN